MTNLRFRPRHVQQTVFDHLETELGTLGWLAAGGFKTMPITLIDYVPEEKNGEPIKPNTVGLTMGSEDDDVVEELGGGLLSVPMVFFVDVYGENQGIALSIASDIKDIFRGTAPGCRRAINLYDYTSAPRQLVAGEYMEFEDVIREKPASTDYRRFWQVVKATARVFYLGPD